MGINIGNNNKIKNSVIGENVKAEHMPKNKSWIERHPFVASIIASLIAGLIMLFSFWDNIIGIINKLFGG